MCQGATQSYAGILVCRFFLGLAEAGFYPGVLYHFSFWFPTERLALRIVSQLHWCLGTLLIDTGSFLRLWDVLRDNQRPSWY